MCEDYSKDLGYGCLNPKDSQKIWYSSLLSLNYNINIRQLEIFSKEKCKENKSKATCEGKERKERGQIRT